MNKIILFLLLFLVGCSEPPPSVHYEGLNTELSPEQIKKMGFSETITGEYKKRYDFYNYDLIETKNGKITLLYICRDC